MDILDEVRNNHEKQSSKINHSKGKAEKYLMNKLKGMNVIEAAKEAGYSDTTIYKTGQIESSQAYKEAENKYREALLQIISPASIAFEHSKNIMQDADKGAKNKAIEMAYKLNGAFPKDDGTDKGQDDFTVVVQKKHK